jgi:uncharacterized delta-60 repeat protein
MLKGNRLAHGRVFGAAGLLGIALAVAAPGDLDPEFGDGGLLSLRFSEFGHSATAVAQQTDGKLLIVGLGDVILDNDDDFVVARLGPDGALDTGFGIAGAAVEDYSGFFDIPYAVLQQPDGKIVLAGAVGLDDSASDLGFARFNTDGTLDAAFGSGGWATIDLGGDDEAANCLILQPGGGLVAAGYTNASGMYRPAFVRVTDTGVLDTAFGTAGITLLDFSADSSYADDCAQQSSGKLVSVGRVVSFTGETSLGFARLTADGLPDPSFGAGGLVMLPIEADFEEAFSVVIQPDDSIVTSGFESMPGADHWNAVLRRLNPDGVPDAAFGLGGKSVFDFGSESIFYELVAQTDGVIVTTGYRLTGEFFPDLILARFDATGQLDTGFGIDGVAVADFGAGDVPPYGVGYGLVRQADGKYVAVGNNFNTGSMIVARFDDVAAVPGRVGFTNTFRSAQESDGSVSYTVRRTGGRSGAISVDYATAAGEAEPGADFVSLSGTLSWSDGETDEKTLTIDLIDDSDSERSESFALRLTDPTGGAVLAASEATTQITSTDGPGELLFLYQLFDSAVVGTEGDSGLTVPVLRGFGSEGVISVSYTVLGGGTATEGEDFVMSGTLSWADGDTDSKSITIDYLEDTLVEGTESFRIALDSPTGGATLHDSYRFQDFNIRDNNRGFGFSSPSVSVSEQAASVAVTVVASDPQGAAASIEYSTASGSATSDADFTSTSGTLTWVAGDPERKTIEIPISDDAQDEPAETFTVTLANPTEGFALGTAAITVTIVDNDFTGGGGGGSGGGSGSGGGALAWLELLGLAALAWLGRIQKIRGQCIIDIAV